MAQMLAGDIRKGVTFEFKSGVYTVTDFQHVKPGKGAAFVRTTLKNVVTGQVLSDQTFNPTAKLETVQVETKKMTYSYFDGEFYVFMDEEYNQTMLTHDQVEDALKYIKENAEPGVKGNTATNVMKNAKVETGAIIQVPMFVNEGETIRIDTRTGEYMSRV